MKLTVKQLKHLIREQIKESASKALYLDEQFYETSKKEDDEEEFNFDKKNDNEDDIEEEDNEFSHSGTSLKDAQKEFENGAGAYLEALLGEGWSRFDAVQQLVSLLRKIFKGGHTFKLEEK